MKMHKLTKRTLHVRLSLPFPLHCFHSEIPKPLSNMPDSTWSKLGKDCDREAY